VKFEKNGVKTNLKPWTPGAVVGLTSDQVGSLTWGTLAEMEHPVATVNYQTVEDFILVSKYRHEHAISCGVHIFSGAGVTGY
jgi:hypothetical protein